MLDRLDLTWDASTAAAAVVAACLLFLFAVRKGFAPLVSK